MSYTFRIIAAATLVAILAFQVTAAAAPPLPVEAQRLTPQVFEAWAKRSNANAYAAAAKRATPGTRVLVEGEGSTTVVDGNVFDGTYFDWACGRNTVTRTQSTTSRTRSKRAYELNRYGGGPVWIINPYCPPRSK